MSVGTSDTTVISSTKTEARNLNTTNASAAQRDDSSPAPKNRQKQISDTELRHARLGHPGVKLYNTMARLLGYNTIKQPNTTFCPTCCLSKAVTRKGIPVGNIMLNSQHSVSS